MRFLDREEEMRRLMRLVEAVRTLVARRGA
jgi:hypothetical protein